MPITSNRRANNQVQSLDTMTLTSGKEPQSVIEEKIRSGSSGYFYTPTLWWNPKSKTIFSDNKDHYDIESPVFDFPVMDMEEHVRALAKYERGDTNDKLGAAMAGLHPELGRYYEEYSYVKEDMDNNNIGLMKALDRNIAQAGILRRDDFSYIKTLETESNLVVPLPQAHVLTQAVTVIPTTQLQFKYARVGDNFDVVTRKMAELQVPFTAQPTFTVAEQSLDRFGTHIATSWEFRNERFDVDVYNTLLQFYRGKMDEQRNKTIADIFNAKSVGALGGTWTATTGSPPQMTRNPVPDLKALSSTVNNTNRGIPNKIVSNDAVYTAYHSSTPWIVGTANDPAVNPQPYQNSINYIGTTGRLFPGMSWVVDSFIAAGKVFVLDSRGIRFWDGPERTISYGMMQTEVEGVINKAYWAAAEVEASIFVGNSGAA